MKPVKYILIGIVVLVVLVLAAAVIVPIVYKDKIVELGKAEANKYINAELDFNNDIDISIFKSFPDVTLDVRELKIINKEPFAGDTLVFLPEFSTTLDIMSIIRGEQYKVKRIYFGEPYIKLKVLKDGTANWDIAIADEDSLAAEGVDTTSSFSMALKEYEINNGTLIYDDQSLEMVTRLGGLTHTGKGDFSEDIFDLDTRTLIKELTFGYGGVNYLEGVETELVAELNMNMPDMKFAFKENELRLNALELGFDGFVAMPTDDIEMDLTFNSKENSFKNILSLIPTIYTRDFADLKASGRMAIAGMVKGIYNETTYPAFNVDIDIENGMFKYPDLPSAVTDVFVDANITSKGGDLDNMVISVPKMSFAMAGAPFVANLLLTNPMTDMFIDAGLKGNIKLGSLKEIVKLEEGTTLTGNLETDLKLKGNMSALENEQYDKFYAAGYMVGEGINYAASDLPTPVAVQTARLDFNPQNVKLTNFAMTSGESDLKATGAMSNYLGYVLKDQTLKGNLSISSNYFNVNPWMDEDGETAAPKTAEAESEIEAVELPANLDFTMNADMKRVHYDNMDIDNLVGQILLRNQRIELQDVKMNALGGGFVASGYYETTNPAVPTSSMKLSINEISIPQTFATFASIQQFVPIAKYMVGNASANLTFDTKLDGSMMPLWETFNSVGKLNIQRAVLQGFGPTNEIAERLNIPQMKDIVLKDIKPSYKITEGRFFLSEPVNFSVANIAASVTGSNGIDQSLDYVMATQIPAGALQSNASKLLGDLLKTEAIDLSKLKTVKVNVLIGGTITSPKISITAKDYVQDVTQDLKEQVKEQVDKKVEEVKEDVKVKARAEADRILKEAEQQAAKIRSGAQQAADKVKKEAYAQADKVEAEANNPVAKAAAKLGADRLRKEGDQAAQRIISEGDQKAQQVLNEARRKADELLK